MILQQRGEEMSQKNRHKILEVKSEVLTNQTKREILEQQLVEAGFNPNRLSEFEMAIIMQIGLLRHEVVEAIDEFGAMVEDYIGEGEE